jgi:hypothetical protein
MAKKTTESYELDNILERAEDALGMSHPGWSDVHPHEIIKAILQAAPQPPEVQADPDRCLDRFALDLMERIWAIGNRHGPDSQRKAQIQVELIESLEPFYSGRNKQTIDAGKVREILESYSEVLFDLYSVEVSAIPVSDVPGIAEKIVALVGCDKTIHDAIQYLINKTFGGSFPDGGFEIYMAGIGAAMDAVCASANNAEPTINHELLSVAREMLEARGRVVEPETMNRWRDIVEQAEGNRPSCGKMQISDESISTSDRLPTAEDSDCELCVWWLLDGIWIRALWYFGPCIDSATHWQPTGLRKPEEPEV